MIHAFFTIIVSGNAIIGWREYHIFSLTNTLVACHPDAGWFWQSVCYSADIPPTVWPLHFRHANQQPCWRNLNHYHTFLTGEEPGPQSTWHLDGWRIKMLLPRLYWQQGGTAAYGPNQHQGTCIQSPKPLLILLLTTMGLTSYCYNKSLSCTTMRANISTKIRSSDISWLAINPRHPCDQLGNQSQTAARTVKVRMTQRTNICTVLHPITSRSFCMNNRQLHSWWLPTNT